MFVSALEECSDDELRTAGCPVDDNAGLDIREARSTLVSCAAQHELKVNDTDFFLSHLAISCESKGCCTFDVTLPS